MTLDERLEFLVQSTESLHATTQQQSAEIARMMERMNQLDARERQGRRAILAAMRAYLDSLNGDSGETE